MNTQIHENVTKFLDEKIKSRDMCGIYCFYGKEDYMLDYYIKKIYDVAAESGSPELDCISFDDDNFDTDEFAVAVMSYPVSSDFKFVVVKHSELGKLKSEVKSEIMNCLSDINGNVCIIFKSVEFSAGERKSTPKKNTKTQKKSKTSSQNIELIDFLRDNAVMCEFKENTWQSLVRWIKKITASENINISDSNASYILRRTGSRMYYIRNELDKLIAYVKAENRIEINEKEINLLVADKSGSEIDAFELSNAVTSKNYSKATEILEKHRIRKDEPFVILGQISRSFFDMLSVNLAMADGVSDRAVIAKKTGMHEYKVKLLMECIRAYRQPSRFISYALELCRTCDLHLKSTPLPHYQTLENLIYSLSLIERG